MLKSFVFVNAAFMIVICDLSPAGFTMTAKSQITPGYKKVLSSDSLIFNAHML